MPVEQNSEDILSYSLDWGNSNAEKGEVFTKPEIVNFMLQTSGLSAALKDTKTRILEPSCGQGEFVIAIINELCCILRELPVDLIEADRFKNLITAFDISSSNIEIAKIKTVNILKSVFDESEAKALADGWFKNDDFLLNNEASLFNYIIGNPPYVRIERIPTRLLKIYRDKFSTMKERADLYVAFFEKSLSLLEKNGVLSFICTDRWIKNKYGSSLREFISQEYHLDLYVDMYGQTTFQADVLTYPAITQLSRRKKRDTIIIHNPRITEEFSELVTRSMLNSEEILFEGKIIRSDIVNGSKPWMMEASNRLDLIHRLEREYPLLEEAKCHVFIGAATGNNKVYIVDRKVDIEPCRRIPMIKAADIKDGILTISDQFIINTYNENGVIRLEDYPKLKNYLECYADQLKNRHVAKKFPSAWFKTIDRVYPERAKKEKLLIPDIKSKLSVVYDVGKYHPNNSIYYICSETWSLRALQAVLMSGLGQLFIEAYSTKVSGGNLRFQAQHLRKIRLPLWKDVSEDMRIELEKSAIDRNTQLAQELVYNLYNFTEKEKLILDC